MVVYTVRTSDGKAMNDRTYHAFNASQYGYGYRFKAGVPTPTGHFEGYGLFYARKKKQSATNGIIVKYVYANSSLSTISYGVNIGAASISVSGDVDDLTVYAKNMSFTY